DGEQAARLFAAAGRGRVHANLQVEAGSRSGNSQGARGAAGGDSGADEWERIQRQMDSVRGGAVGRTHGGGGAALVRRSGHFAADRGAEFWAGRAVSDSAAIAGGDLCGDVWEAGGGAGGAVGGAGGKRGGEV